MCGVSGILTELHICFTITGEEIMNNAKDADVKEKINSKSVAAVRAGKWQQSFIGL